MLEKFLGQIDWDKVRIKRYPNRIFLCGSGQTASIRAILRDYSSKDYKYVFAEDAMSWPDAKAFSSDFLELEEYLAAAVKLIVIVSESPGSFAEMGAFVSNLYIKDRLLFVTEEQYYKAHSFIRYGIIQHLQGKSLEPTSQICVIPTINSDEERLLLKEQIVSLVSSAIASFRETPTEKFNIHSPHSQILLVREIIALSTVIENTKLQKIIGSILRRKQTLKFKELLSRILFILEKLDLIQKHFLGNQIFYVTVDPQLCLQYPKLVSGKLAIDLQSELRTQLYRKDNPQYSLIRSILPNPPKEDVLKDESLFLTEKKLGWQLPLMYKVFFIPKKRGGKREIAQPTNFLKQLQRKQLMSLSALFKVHSAATAYIAGENGIKANAAIHLKGKYFLKLDFKDFFHSIKAKDFNYFLEKEGISLKDRAKYLKTFFMFDKSVKKTATSSVYKILKNSQTTDENIIKLMTGKFSEYFRLSIGAPSSPMISNMIMYEFDSNLFDWCSVQNISYSRYADDLTFSCNFNEGLSGVIGKIKSILKGIPYLKIELNTQKTRKLSLKNRVTVTGLNITSQHKISVGREQKKKIRAMLFHFKNETLPLEMYAYLKGWISYLKDIEPEYFNSLKKSYKDEMQKLFSYSVDNLCNQKTLRN